MADETALIVAVPHLPIRSRCRAVQLIAGTSVPGTWQTVAEFPLGQGLSRSG